MDKKNPQNKLIIILIALLAISLVANIVLVVVLAGQSEEPDRYLYDPEYALGKDNTEIIENPEDTQPMEDLPLELVHLECPEELAQQLEIKVEEEGSRADIRFLGQVDGKAVELFSFALNSNAEAEGYVLGTLQDPHHGEIYVVMHMNEQDPEDWSAEGYQQICQLQERVNDFIIQFHEDARFTPKR